MAGDDTEYERGVVAGAIETRLAGHDRHFAAINGHLADVAETLNRVELTLQRLADQATGRDATTRATATAVRDASDARRAESERRWTPVQRASVVVSLVIAAAALYLALRGWLAA